MKNQNHGTRIFRAALVGLVLAAACAGPALAWNPGDATSPENKWVKVDGANFTLRVSGQSQAYQGTINGRTLQSSWPGRPAAEKMTGEVVQVSDKGRALVIRWSNGIEFKR